MEGKQTGKKNQALVVDSGYSVDDAERHLFPEPITFTLQGYKLQDKEYRKVKHYQYVIKNFNDFWSIINFYNSYKSFTNTSDGAKIIADSLRSNSFSVHKGRMRKQDILKCDQMVNDYGRMQGLWSFHKIGEHTTSEMPAEIIKNTELNINCRGLGDQIITDDFTAGILTDIIFPFVLGETEMKRVFLKIDQEEFDQNEILMVTFNKTICKIKYRGNTDYEEGIRIRIRTRTTKGSEYLKKHYTNQRHPFIVSINIQ